MASFKVFKLNELMLVWLRIYPNGFTATPTPTNDFFKSLTPYCISLTMNAFNATSAVFLYENWSDIVIALRVTMAILGTVQALGMFISVGCKIDKVRMLHQKLQSIVDQAAKDNHHRIAKMYWETEQKCSVYTKRMLTYIYFHQMANVAALIKAISGICANDIDTSTWNLPFNLVVPFDTRPVCGWFLKWMFELSCGFAYTLAMIIPTSYFFCFCMYIVAICKHFEMLVDRIRLDVQWIRAGHKSRRECEHMWNKLRKNVFQLIDIHSNVMDIFDLVEVVNSVAIFFLLPSNSVALGLSLYTMENSGGDGIVIDVICVICALMWCSLFCYFGDVASDRLFSIGYASFSSNWYDFPIGWQKSIVLIILRSQQRVQFNGLNLINCTVEVLGKLFKSACSYYLIFRSFSQS